MSCNGWDNYKTWKIVTEVSNNESSYLYWKELAEDLTPEELCKRISEAFGIGINVAELYELFRSWRKDKEGAS